MIFVDLNYMKETRGPKMSKKGVVCLCMWNVYFSTNLDGLFFSMFLIKLNLYSMLKDLLWLLLFLRYKGVTMGPTRYKIYNFYFKYDFDSFNIGPYVK